ncbi:MAG: dethiobiotin synthase [Alphaproteobacteria bacterium]
MTSRGYFVTGTDTDVGKTVVSAILCRALGAGYWKPVQAGLQPATDVQTVKQLAGGSMGPIFPSRHVLRQPRSPHEAAAAEGVSIDLSDFKLPESTGPLVVEGAGGALVPLNGHAVMADLMKSLGLPVVVVARTTLGTINHTCLTVEALRGRGIRLAGLVMNGEPDAENRKALVHYARAPVLLDVPRFERLDGNVIEAWLASLPVRNFIQSSKSDEI